MSRSVYVMAPDGHTGKSTIALGLIDLFVRQVERVGVFRPIARSDAENDTVLSLLLNHDAVDLTYEECVGVTYDDVHSDPEVALATIIGKFRKVEAKCDVVVIVGSDYTDVTGPTELTYNAKIAANLGSSVVLVTSGVKRSPEDIRQAVEFSTQEIASSHANVVGVVVNRVNPDELENVREQLAGHPTPTWVVPNVPLLSAPSMGDLLTAVDGELFGGDVELLEREAIDAVVCGMTMENFLDHLIEGSVVIVAGDRSDAILAAVSAHAAAGFPSLAGLILNGGFTPPAQVSRLIQGLGQRLPVITTQYGTYETTRRVADTRGLLSTGSQRKIDTARATFEANIDADEILAALNVPRTQVVTPLMFEYDLVERARAQRKHIVLPEGGDERILRAASTILARDVADLTILGDEQVIQASSRELGLDISAATIIDPARSEYRDQFAQVYTEARAHRGMTLERAKEVVLDVSYFGTLMVQLGYADGMVSGALHTTAHTIKPSFEVIKTSEGTSIVSSVFFMCLQDRVLVYGDCAVNPDPTAEQLADIAISSAATAAQFGVEPRVAMLSYSTGASGSGADVDKVRLATEIVKQRAPELVVEGPIQYDAAVDASVAATKMPDSEVAGKATVLIFPDLNTGNNTYKAVQRSAGAVAIGPVLQGLRKPVNDLSRGALVQDIVNTVAITAIQAQN